MGKRKPAGPIYKDWREWERKLLAKVAEVKRALLRPRVVRVMKKEGVK